MAGGVWRAGVMQSAIEAAIRCHSKVGEWLQSTAAVANALTPPRGDRLDVNVKISPLLLFPRLTDRRLFGHLKSVFILGNCLRVWQKA